MIESGLVPLLVRLGSGPCSERDAASFRFVMLAVPWLPLESYRDPEGRNDVAREHDTELAKAYRK